nr:adenylyl-sulfate kinase [Victivallales bacterium]
EAFNSPKITKVEPGMAAGLTLETQIYVKPGELLCKKGEKIPLVSNKLIANVFWMGKAPFIRGKRYKLKIGSDRTYAELVEVVNVIDASDLSSVKGKQQLDRHDVGLCVIETSKPIAFDLVNEIENTGRFVIVDSYDISGGGIITGKAEDKEDLLSDRIRKREFAWDTGLISPRIRNIRNHHKGKFVVFTGENQDSIKSAAKTLEQELFNIRLNSYYLGISNVLEGLDSDVGAEIWDRDEHIRRIGELARIMTDAGLIFITAIERLDEYDVEKLRLLNSPNEIVLINIGEEKLNRVDLNIAEETEHAKILSEVMEHLGRSNIIPNYFI